jgi:uncharacterized protein YndB with AHSA1/START domain
MPYSFTLTSRIPASARQIYDAWLGSRGHSEMTGGKARMSDVLGAEVSAWNGYISGRNLELAPPVRIVQSWRTTKFTGQHQDSIITVTLEEVGDGTLLTLVHSNVPDDQRSYEEGGWQSNYFEPMRRYFGGGQQKRPAKPGKRRTKRSAASKSGSKAKRAKTGKSGPVKRKPIKRKPIKLKPHARKRR